MDREEECSLLHDLVTLFLSSLGDIYVMLNDVGGCDEGSYL